MAFGEFWERPKIAKALKLTLGVALKVLETTGDVLDTTPIPGAAAVIKVILEVAERQERAVGNSKLTREQRERWKKLVDQLKESEMDLENTSPDALSKLRDASKELAGQLQGFVGELEEATYHKIRPRWMTCTEDEEALQDFLHKSNEAITDYQLAQGRRIEECVRKIQRVVEVIDTKVDRVDVTVDRIDANVDQVGATVEQVDTKVERVDATVDRIDAKVDQIDATVDRVDVAVDRIRVKVDRIESTTQSERDESKIKEFDRLIETRRAPLAPFNAPRRVGTLSKCSEGTRVPLLQIVADWRKGQNGERVFWLKERAGFGKTTIALSVAEQAAEEGTLAASFFFSYQIPDLSNTSHFLPTIIHQLCLFGGAPYKQRFAKAISKHASLLDARLKDQAQKLFLDPLDTFTLAPAGAPIVIVIDALDECQHEDAEYLTVFIASLSSLNLPLKIFITSRPESQITAPFSDLGVKPCAVPDTSNEDVETYLRAELAKIPSKPSIRDLHLPRDWIKEEDIQGLLKRAGVKEANSDPKSAEKGLFVYIATVVRFIGDTRRCNPSKLLEIVLSATPLFPSYRPSQALDNIYTRVLDLALGGAEDLLQQFHAVVGGRMAVHLQPMADISTTTLERLLDLPQGEIRRTLVNLQSVIQFPDTDSALPSFYHRSFTDFLTSPDRSGPHYYIDLKLHRKHLALGCLRVISTSSLKAEVINAMDEEGYFYYPATNMPPEFVYASFGLSYYYKEHPGDKDLLEELENFMKADFGWWIEFFSKIGSYDFTWPTISETVDPQDKRDLPILFRAIVTSAEVWFVDTDFHVHALLRKELRWYISAITQQQDGESRQAMTMSFKKCIYELTERVGLAGNVGDREGRHEAAALAILATAKDIEAAVDRYQLSIGDEEEVARSRERTAFLRRQVKTLLSVDNDHIPIPANQLEAFEQEGLWTPIWAPDSRYSEPDPLPDSD